MRVLRVIGTSRGEGGRDGGVRRPGRARRRRGTRDGPAGGAASVEAAQARAQWQAVVPLSVNVLPDCGTNCQS
ncbi:hypothetical protein Skr01_40690 [Sphaerisporangium krabiense]|nr:hypothetical protein Skr01_40690 [Sphaerisporangium krabiense]